MRFRSVSNVTDEIKLLNSQGVKYINFDDDTFGVTRKYLFELCNGLIKDCPGVKWSCEIHVKLVDDEVFTIMKKAGCDLIKLGVESGNNQILKEIHKGITIIRAPIIIFQRTLPMKDLGNLFQRLKSTATKKKKDSETESREIYTSKYYKEVDG